jgi:hypothetical protein
MIQFNKPPAGLLRNPNKEGEHKRRRSYRRKTIRHKVCTTMCKPTFREVASFDNEYRLNLDDAVIVTSVPMHGDHPDA